MKTVSVIKWKRWLGGCPLLLSSLLLSGCGHLAYVDPNPTTPYAFPGQPGGLSQGVASAPAPAGSPIGQPVFDNSNTGLAPVVIPNTSAPAGSPGVGSDSAGSSILRPQEFITITFSDLPPPGIPDRKIQIGEDGKITLPLNITVMAAGKTARQLEEAIRAEYVPRFFVQFTASVKPEERVYFVGGEVRAPSRQLYPGDMTVLRAIDTAGGFTDFADRKKIELRRSNGQKYKVDWKKAMQNPKLDLPVYANDQVIVPKKSPFGL